MQQHSVRLRGGRTAAAQQRSKAAVSVVGSLLQWRSGFSSNVACSDSAVALFAVAQGGEASAAQWQEDCCSGTASGCAWGGQQRHSNAAAAAAQGLCCSGAVALAAAQRAATAQQRYLQRRRGKQRQQRSGKKIAAAAQCQAARGAGSSGTEMQLSVVQGLCCSGAVDVAVAQRENDSLQRAATAQQCYCSGAGETAAVCGAAGSKAAQGGAATVARQPQCSANNALASRQMLVR